MAKKALITGITGQDGSYLADLLLEKGYEVHGMVRRSSIVARSRIDHLATYREGPNPSLFLHYADISDSFSVVKLLYDIQPDEIYNLACQSHVKVSFEMPTYTAEVAGLGAARLLEGIIETNLTKKTRVFQASSSEMFGLCREGPQNEATPFRPRSPYGCAKAYAHWLVNNYRESHGVHASCGIMYNHESPRRAENFVTRKITKTVAEIKKGLRDSLTLGNLEAKRDWGYAKEYVEAMWLALQQERPDDYIFATNTQHSIKDFLVAAFGRADLDWQDYVKFDERLLRPIEGSELRGDFGKAKEELGWEPKTLMPQLAELMVDADFRALE